MRYLRQSTASQEQVIGPFVDDTDFKTLKTALTIANTDIKLVKGGATAEVNKNSGGGTHIATGRYSIVFDATDTNTLGSLFLAVNVAGALPVWHEFEVIAAEAYDALQSTGNGIRADVRVMQANVLTAAAINADAFTAAKFDATFGTEVATAVWANGTRVLTAGTNIVLAKGTGITGFNDLDAAGVAGAVWNAATTTYGTAGSFGLLVETNLDAAVSSRSTFAGGAVQSVTDPVTVGTVNDKTGYSLAAAGLDGIVIEAGVNPRQALSAILASVAGKLAGAGTGTITIYAGANPATQRIVATVDGSNNRTAVTLSLPA